LGRGQSARAEQQAASPPGTGQPAPGPATSPVRLSAPFSRQAAHRWQCPPPRGGSCASACPARSR
jgi:hypothetical protein